MVTLKGRHITVVCGTPTLLSSVPRAGDVVFAMNRDEVAALVAAVEIAFDEVADIPEGMRPAADALWAATHSAREDA